MQEIKYRFQILDKSYNDRYYKTYLSLYDIFLSFEGEISRDDLDKSFLEKKINPSKYIPILTNLGYFYKDKKIYKLSERMLNLISFGELNIDYCKLIFKEVNNYYKFYQRPKLKKEREAVNLLKKAGYIVIKKRIK